jgi:hypothetical protein
MTTNGFSLGSNKFGRKYQPTEAIMAATEINVIILVGFCDKPALFSEA